jgi:hypothetical protein
MADSSYEAYKQIRKLMKKLNTKHLILSSIKMKDTLQERVKYYDDMYINTIDTIIANSKNYDKINKSIEIKYRRLSTDLFNTRSVRRKRFITFTCDKRKFFIASSVAISPEKLYFPDFEITFNEQKLSASSFEFDITIKRKEHKKFRKYLSLKKEAYTYLINFINELLTGYKENCLSLID